MRNIRALAYQEIILELSGFYGIVATAYKVQQNLYAILVLNQQGKDMYFKCAFFFCYFLGFSLSAESSLPVPSKRKKQLTIEKIVEEPVPKRRKTLSQIEKFETKNEDEVIISITNSIRNQLEKCWNIPSSASYKENFSIKVNLLLSPQGEVVMTDIIDTDSYQKNSLFRSTADSAMRAVYKCNPLNLPSKHYNIWREIILDFILNEKK